MIYVVNCKSTKNIVYDRMSRLHHYGKSGGQKRREKTNFPLFSFSSIMALIKIWPQGRGAQNNENDSEKRKFFIKKNKKK